MTSTPRLLASHPDIPSIHARASFINLLLFQFPATTFLITFVLSIGGQKSASRSSSPHVIARNFPKPPAPLQSLLEAHWGFSAPAPPSSRACAGPGARQPCRGLVAHRRRQKPLFSTASLGPRRTLLGRDPTRGIDGRPMRTIAKGHSGRSLGRQQRRPYWTTSALETPNSCTCPLNG